MYWYPIIGMHRHCAVMHDIIDVNDVHWYDWIIQSLLVVLTFCQYWRSFTRHFSIFIIDIKVHTLIHHCICVKIQHFILVYICKNWYIYKRGKSDFSLWDRNSNFWLDLDLLLCGIIYFYLISAQVCESTSLIFDIWRIDLRGLVRWFHKDFPLLVLDFVGRTGSDQFI